MRGIFGTQTKDMKWGNSTYEIEETTEWVNQQDGHLLYHMEQDLEHTKTDILQEKEGKKIPTNTARRRRIYNSSTWNIN